LARGCGSSALRGLGWLAFLWRLRLGCGLGVLRRTLGFATGLGLDLLDGFIAQCPFPEGVVGFLDIRLGLVEPRPARARSELAYEQGKRPGMLEGQSGTGVGNGLLQCRELAKKFLRLAMIAEANAFLRCQQGLQIATPV